MTVSFPSDSKVRLKSGGPVMMFSHYRELDLRRGWSMYPPFPHGCFCIWFDSTG